MCLSYRWEAALTSLPCGVWTTCLASTATSCGFVTFNHCCWFSYVVPRFPSAAAAATVVCFRLFYGFSVVNMKCTCHFDLIVTRPRRGLLSIQTVSIYRPFVKCTQAVILLCATLKKPYSHRRGSFPVHWLFNVNRLFRYPIWTLKEERCFSLKS